MPLRRNQGLKAPIQSNALPRHGSSRALEFLHSGTVEGAWYQGLASAMPQNSQKESGFSP
jgi:hypothetical protein